jgi:hypothetical protein
LEGRSPKSRKMHETLRGPFDLPPLQGVSLMAVPRVETRVETLG